MPTRTWTQPPSHYPQPPSGVAAAARAHLGRPGAILTVAADVYDDGNIDPDANVRAVAMLALYAAVDGFDAERLAVFRFRRHGTSATIPEAELDECADVAAVVVYPGGDAADAVETARRIARSRPLVLLVHPPDAPGVDALHLPGGLTLTATPDPDGPIVDGLATLRYAATTDDEALAALTCLG